MNRWFKKVDISNPTKTPDGVEFKLWMNPFWVLLLKTKEAFRWLLP